MSNSLYQKVLELKKNEQSLDDLVHNSDNPVVVLDKDYNIVNMNKPATSCLCKTTGFTKKTSWIEFCKKNNIVVDVKVGMESFFSNDLLNAESFSTIIHNLEQTNDVTIEWRIVSFFAYNVLIGSNIFSGKTKTHDDVIDYSEELPFLLANSIKDLTSSYKTKELLERFLLQIMTSLGFQGNVKNENLEYVFFSDKSHRVLGIDSLDDIKGKTVHALKLPADYTEQVSSVDNDILMSKKSRVGFTGKPFLDAKGEVKQLKISKIPLLDEKGNVIFLLTLAIDSNTIKNPSHVRRLYHLVYRSKEVAHNKFIKHYGLDKFKGNDENSILTEREVDVILSLTRHNNVKMVASDLDINEGTVRKHIDSIKYKMGCYSKTTIADDFLKLVEETNNKISF